MASDGIELRDLGIGDAGWLIQHHAELYHRDEGFDASFEVLVARILADFIETRDPSCERAWIAWCDGKRLGSIFCVRGERPDEAKLRLFLVMPQARGTGLGQRLLDACIAHARAQGYLALTLWTHESHRSACALYKKAGFACLAFKPVRSFGVDLVEQAWRLDLTAD
ncbi:Acetyltransferase, GNAT family [Roseibacterium elongatum DSM 19469]|uniref:Acetyltransferase, GNAT family n=1 Tax=Roseicyclus elongatus DSM 19469 TaxID=1294273 RepID=W8RSU1_9RHOB|nr:GNAT family N-acetyltransferase [Roseibacterium elongatum]AHM04203.1 Acetyltransferase, GNAT family [Roseibacterium elongatum DSM 19469]